MDLMKKKLITDFFDADEIDRSIAKMAVEIEYGVPVLRGIIKDFIREDIRTIDAGTYKVLIEKAKELDEINKKAKENIVNGVKAEDEIDKRNLDLRLLREDHQRWHRELLIIQNLMNNKGWFHIE